MAQVRKSEELFERAKKVSPGGVHSPVRAFRGVGGVPRFIERAQGSKLWDVEGNQYLDFCMGWGPMIFGHADPEMKEVLLRALEKGWSYGAAEPYSLELAEWICKELPWVEKVRFVNSGTEAVMSALRVARAATGRDHILKFEGCYHGHADSMLVKAGSGLAEMPSPDSAGVSVPTASETRVLPLDDEGALERFFEAQGHLIAAVILEPLPANNGLLIQRESFLKKIQDLARRHGALVIWDEVISGFRVGLGGMAGECKIKPDLVTFGKVIGGGFPVGAYGGRADLMDLVAPQGPVYQAGTLSANPVAMQLGLAMLKRLKGENPYAALAEKTRSLCGELRGLLQKSGVIAEVQQHASLFWVAFGTSEPVRSIAQIHETQKSSYAKLFHGLLSRGIYLAPSGYEVSFLSTAHSDRDLEFFLECFEGSLKP